MKKTYEKQLDSNSYRRLLEFIKQQETTTELIEYFIKLSSINKKKRLN